jgi:hypothetical protein
MLQRFVCVLPSAAVRTFSTTEQRAPPNGSVLGLYRMLFRQSAKISNYNFREHAKRRSREEFRESRALEAEAAMAKFKFGIEQLEIVKRYSVLSHFYKGEVSVLGK